MRLAVIGQGRLQGCQSRGQCVLRIRWIMGMRGGGRLGKGLRKLVVGWVGDGIENSVGDGDRRGGSGWFW